MTSTNPTRRTFCLSAAATLLAPHRHAAAQPKALTHPDVAAIDHDRILLSASAYLNQPAIPLTAIPAPRSPGTPHDLYSEAEDFFPDPTSPSAPWLHKPGTINPDAFTAHRDAIHHLGVAVASLTAAYIIGTDPRYAAKAADHLRAWFIAPATRINPDLQYAQCIPGTKVGRPEGVLDTTPLAEVARSIKFLATTDALTPVELAALHKWFADFFTWLNESRTAGLARDMRDHHASSWLFQAAAYADLNVTGLSSDDASLNALRHRFRTVTLRAQLVAAGNFPREVSTPTPYRNSLFNLDLLTLACDLLTTRFDNPWEYELQDGPGMRSAIAYHFPYILNRATWPYPADITHFKELPARRISLLLAGRAYRRPEYTDLWKSLVPLSGDAPLELKRTFPIAQPLLWFTDPKISPG